MLYRKIEKHIRQFLESKQDKTLIIQGARQIGKSFIIRHVGSMMFKNFIEINLVEDKNGPRLFAEARTVEDFYLRLSMIHGDKMDGDRNNTLIFLDEIQEYPHLLTILKFLNADGRYSFIASGSLLGVTLGSTTSIPVGSLRIMDMFPLDFEEFIRANGVGALAIDAMRSSFKAATPIDEAMHRRMIDLWKKYLIIGGMPDAVNTYLKETNIAAVRAVQSDIVRLYAADASKYDSEHRLVIQRVYQLIPSNMENKKKRVVAKDIENKPGSRFSSYMEEFEYLIHSGIALGVMAVSNPKFPLAESTTKNFIKLYMNDPGLLTNILYGNDAQAVLDDRRSVNLGSAYESAVAAQLKALGHRLFYYDNKKKGEVDFLVNDNEMHSILPIEVKSGKDYTVHSAISNLASNPDYDIRRAIVLSNAREVKIHNGILHVPIYYTMFIN